MKNNQIKKTTNNVIEMTEKMVSMGAADVLCERAIQIMKYSKEHDAEWVEAAQLIEASMCYATIALDEEPEKRVAPLYWPWAEETWKPEGRRRDLVKAAALLIAEIDRIDAAEKKNSYSIHGSISPNRIDMDKEET